MGFTTPSGTEITSKPGLLVSLAKYAPRPQSNPKENFLTEAFAYLLRIPDSRVGCVAAELLSELTERDFEPAPCQIVTQLGYDRGMVDMQLDSFSWSVIIENKLGSTLALEGDTLRENQLRRYLEIQHAKGVSHWVLVLTRDPDPLEVQEALPPDLSDNFLGYHRWHEVYQWLERKSNEMSFEPNDVTQFLVDQFLELMRSESMNPPKPLSEADPRLMNDYRQRKQDLSNWIREVYLRLSRTYELPPRKGKRSVGETYAYEWIEVGDIRMYLSLGYRSADEYGISIEIEDSGARDYKLLSDQNRAKVVSLEYERFPGEPNELARWCPFDPEFLAMPGEKQLQRAVEWFSSELQRLSNVGLVRKKTTAQDKV